MLTGILFILVWTWLSMSTIDYRVGAPFHGLQTAGWFIFGMPFLIGIGLFVTSPFTLIARKIHVAAGWVSLLVVGLLLIGYAYNAALPMPRLGNTLGVDLPDDTKITRLVVSDSFNDGMHTFGVFSGSEELMQRIADANGLSRGNFSLLVLNQRLDVDSLPEMADAYRSDLMTCYFDSDTSTIYVYCRSGPPRP